jgi:hypothetical protein
LQGGAVVDVIDLYGNNAIVVCPECRGPYIVRDFLDKRGLRKCPHCNAANGITFVEARNVKDAPRNTKQRNYKAVSKRTVHLPREKK